MCEPYTLSLERSREHGAAVNCADRRNIAVVKVLSPVERVSSASAAPRSVVRLLPLGRDSLPTPLWITPNSPPVSHAMTSVSSRRARASFRTGTTTTSGDSIDVGNKIRSPARAARTHIHVVRVFHVETPSVYINIKVLHA